MIVHEMHFVSGDDDEIRYEAHVRALLDRDVDTVISVFHETRYDGSPSYPLGIVIPGVRKRRVACNGEQPRIKLYPVLVLKGDLLNVCVARNLQLPVAVLQDADGALELAYEADLLQLDGVVHVQGDGPFGSLWHPVEQRAVGVCVSQVPVVGHHQLGRHRFSRTRGKRERFHYVVQLLVFLQHIAKHQVFLFGGEQPRRDNHLGEVVQGHRREVNIAQRVPQDLSFVLGCAL